MASGYKVGGVDLDEIFELRDGRTPIAPETGFKVNGVDLSNRYLSRTHGSAVGGPDVEVYVVEGVDLADYFSTKLQNTVTEAVAFSSWSTTTKTATFLIDYYSSTGRDDNFLYGGYIGFNLNVFNPSDPGEEIVAFRTLFNLHQPIRYTKTGSFNFFDVSTGGIYYDNTTSSLQTIDTKSGTSGTNYLIRGRKSGESSIELTISLTKGSSSSLSSDIIARVTSFNHPVPPHVTLIGIT